MGPQQQPCNIESRAVGSLFPSPCPTSLECSSAVWTPTGPLFVLRRWGLPECDCALTPEAIKSLWNHFNHTMPALSPLAAYSSRRDRPSLKYIETSQATTAFIETYKSTCCDNKMVIWMSDFWFVWAEFDICIKGSSHVPAALIIEMNLKATANQEY